MLIKLLPEQIIKEWEVVKHAIEQANYDQLFATDEAVRDHLRNIILGEMQVWAITEEDEFAGIGVTRFNRDYAMGVKRLEIYVLYGFRPLSQRTWAECFVAIKRFADANKCSHLMALTDNDWLISLANRFGGDTGQRMVVFKV